MNWVRETRSEAVVIRSTTGSGDFLALRAEPLSDAGMDPYAGPDIEVELACGGLRAVATQPAYIADIRPLLGLLREIDEGWRGWDGEKHSRDLEIDWLSASAIHDGKGHVQLRVRVTAGWPMQELWSARAELTIDVGSAGDLASRLERWHARIWPAQYR